MAIGQILFRNVDDAVLGALRAATAAVDAGVALNRALRRLTA
jgi:hypothetical protein